MLNPYISKLDPVQWHRSLMNRVETNDTYGILLRKPSQIGVNLLTTATAPLCIVRELAVATVKVIHHQNLDSLQSIKKAAAHLIGVAASIVAIAAEILLFPFNIGAMQNLALQKKLGLLPQNAAPNLNEAGADLRQKNDPQEVNYDGPNENPNHIKVKEARTERKDAPRTEVEDPDLQKAKDYLDWTNFSRELTTNEREEKAKDHLEKAAEKGSAEAKFLLAKNYNKFYPAATPQQPKTSWYTMISDTDSKALTLYEESADAGYVPALKELAFQYLYAQDATSAHKEKAIQYYTELADKNELEFDDLCRLAETYAKNKNDLVNALKYHMKAVELFRNTDAKDLGNKVKRAEALEKLASEYDFGYFKDQTNAAAEALKYYKEAYDFYKKAADENGNQDAQYEVACYHHWGRYVALDEQEAVKYWKLAAAQNDISSYRKLAEHFESKEEYQTAYDYYKKLVLLGNHYLSRLNIFKEKMAKLNVVLTD